MCYRDDFRLRNPKVLFNRRQAMFCLSECIDLDSPENEQAKRALNAWLAEQDAMDRDTNGILEISESSLGTF